MKTKTLFLTLAAALCLGILGAKAQDELPTDAYYCGFNTQEEFDTWTRATNCDIQWEWNYSYASLQTGFNFGGDTDAWMFSPAINIENPDDLCVRVMMMSASTEWFRFTMGKTASADGQTIEIMDYPEFNNRTPQFYVFDLPDGVEPGTYYFGIQAYNPFMMGSRIDMYSFEVADNTLSTISGIVSSDGGEPVADATITISGDKYKLLTKATDAEGKYSFPEVSPGEYEINVTKADYVSAKETVTVVCGENLEKNITMTYEPRVNVSGKVVDEAGTAISGASVEISGVEFHSTSTGVDGAFLLEGVKVSESEYVLEIKYDLKKTYRSQLSLTGEPEDLGTIALETNVVSPKNIQTDLLQDGMFVSWMMPLRETEFRYDNGSYYGQVSVQGENAAVGVRFAQPVILNGMKWVTTTSYKQEIVDVKVYALDSYGNPTDEILYEADDVATINYDFDGNMQWTEHVFENPVEADNGCLAVIIGPNLYVPYDSGQEPYPYSYQYYIANDYLQDDFINTVFSGNLLVRGFGYILGIPAQAGNGLLKSGVRALSLTDEATVDAPQPEGLTYTLWRLTDADYEAAITSGEITAGTSWTTVKDGIGDLSYYDRSYKQAAQGDYYYALRANYPGGETSDISFSAVTENNMRTNVSLQVYTSMGIGLTDGALVELKGTGDSGLVYTAGVVDGYATFENIRKGIYTMTIEKKGFETIVKEVDFGSGNNYEASYSMTLIPERVVNLSATQDGDEVTLQWNTGECLEEDFEGMEDFAVNCAGDLGWEYIDADGAKTYELAEVTQPFENMGEPMAFIVFNPSKTEPDLFKYVHPHSGNKVLADIAIDQYYAAGKHNDDYLFSPELEFADDFVFSFYAVAGYSGMVAENEQFMVGYTTTGSVATTGIEWLSDEPQEVGGQWTKFTYTIPKDARRVVLRCVSDQRFMFAVDDIYIGYETTLAQQIATFEVYVDEELLGQTATNSFTMSQLSEGDHLARVVAVYTAMDGSRQYSEASELVFSVYDQSGVEAVGAGGAFYYDDDAKLIHTGMAGRVELYDLQGRGIAVFDSVTEVSTEMFSDGVYIVRVTTDKGIETHKIVVR